ncbi:MAG: hypothetical protein ABR955_05960 [Verrucomicrobiota bacterium]|jgi:hypothetical protein
MKIALDPKTEKQIREAVKLGEPYALDELMTEICGNDPILRRESSEIVADEYHRRLSTMPRQEIQELYRRSYMEPTDANKDWLLGEIVESIEAERN